MKFALNYSPQAAQLLRDKRIDLDVYKCPDWPDLIADAVAQRPVYVHFPLKVGRGDMANVDWAKVEGFLRQTDTPYINFHLYPRLADFDKPPTDEEVIERCIQDIDWVGARFGMERAIIENIPYHAKKEGVLHAAIVPEHISQIVHTTGCGFLLDTAHAAITVNTIGGDARDYTTRLPNDHLRELHVTGLEIHDGELSDHFEMQTGDWALLEWVMEHIRSGAWSEPWALVFEYGGISPVFDWRSKSEVIAEQVPRLYVLAQALQPAG
jgi:uncharacterized protein